MEEKTLSRKRGAKHKLHFVALFLILVILPIGTWYYTKAGFTYYRGMVGELHKYEQIPAFSLKDHNGETLELNDIKGRLTVSSFIDLQNDKSQLLADQIQKLYGQFRDRDDVIFLFYSTNPGFDSVGALNAFAKANGLTDAEQCFFLTGSHGELQSILADSYKWPSDFEKEDKAQAYTLSSKDNASRGYYPFVALADTSMTVRNYYAFEDDKSMARLVEHLAVLLPNRGGGKPEMKRNKER